MSMWAIPEAVNTPKATKNLSNPYLATKGKYGMEDFAQMTTAGENSLCQNFPQNRCTV